MIPGYLKGVTGEYKTPTGYFVDEAKAEEFGKEFPYISYFMERIDMLKEIEEYIEKYPEAIET